MRRYKPSCSGWDGDREREAVTALSAVVERRRRRRRNMAARRSGGGFVRAGGVRGWVRFGWGKKGWVINEESG
jgi:hypothetical protein